MSIIRTTFSQKKDEIIRMIENLPYIETPRDLDTLRNKCRVLETYFNQVLKAHEVALQSPDYLAKKRKRIHVLSLSDTLCFTAALTFCGVSFFQHDYENLFREASLVFMIASQVFSKGAYMLMLSKEKGHLQTQRLIDELRSLQKEEGFVKTLKNILQTSLEPSEYQVNQEKWGRQRDFLLQAFGIGLEGFSEVDLLDPSESAELMA